MKNFAFLLLILLSASVFTFSEEITKDESAVSSDEIEEEKISSLSEDRRDTLKYGIDSEIIDLIKKLIDEENNDFKTEIENIFHNSNNPNIVESAVNYLIKIENDNAKDIAYDILLNWENEDSKKVSAALRYISEFYDENTEDAILPLIENESVTLASSAIRAIGKCGTDKSAEILLELLDDDEYEDALKQDIIRALGEMKSNLAIDVLIDILEDVDEDKSWRWTACEALGKIAHPDAFTSIKNALIDDDIYLRSYAVKALTNFEDDEVEDILIQSLRDSFWKVRVSAAEALGERKSIKAIDILIYKAKKDPESNVKIASIDSIGKIGTSDSYDFLRELYKKQNTPASLRTKAAQIIIKDDLSNSLEIIQETISKEWEKDTSAVLSYTCKFLCKEKNPKLSTLFEKMIDHKDISIKIYGLRGIGNNSFSQFKEKIQKFDTDKTNQSVRKAALDAIQKL